MPGSPRLKPDFAYRRQCLSRFIGLATDEDTAVYSGLVPGQVGLYQVNFRVPALPN